MDADQAPDSDPNAPLEFTLPGWQTPAQLARRRQEVGPRAFARGYHQKAISDNELTFPSFSSNVTRTSVPPITIIQSHWRKFTGVDLSSSKRPGIVIFTIAIEPITHRRIVVDIRRGQWSGSQTAHTIIDVYRSLHPDRIMVEDNGYQESLLDWMRQIPNSPTLPLTNFTTGGNKWDPEVGLPSLEVEFSNHAWVIYLPTGHPLACPCAWCVWEQETIQHPTHLTTDTVMAMWLARECARRTGVGAPAGSPPSGLDYAPLSRSMSTAGSGPLGLFSSPSTAPDARSFSGGGQLGVAGPGFGPLSDHFHPF